MSTIRPSTPVTPNSVYDQIDPDHLVEMDECVYCFASTEGGCDCILDENQSDDEEDEDEESESSDYDSVEEEERYISSVIAQVNSLNIPAPIVTRYTCHFPPA